MFAGYPISVCTAKLQPHFTVESLIALVQVVCAKSV